MTKDYPEEVEVKDFRFLGLEPLGDDYEFLVRESRTGGYIEKVKIVPILREARLMKIPTLRMFSEGREKKARILLSIQPLLDSPSLQTQFAHSP